MGVELLVLNGRVAAADMDGEELEPALVHVGRRLLVFGDDDDGGVADDDARVLVRRRAHPASHHQADVHALVHAVGVERLVEPLRQLLARQADVHRDRLRALEQPIEMPVEEGEPPLVDAQPLPHAVAEHEPGIEDRHDRLVARLQLAVHVDEDRRVPRVGYVVHRLGHDRSLVPVNGLGKPLMRDERAVQTDKRT